MRDWGKIAPNKIKSDANLLKEFASDYLNVVGKRLNIGCKSCFLDKHYEFLKKLQMDTIDKPLFLLKKKYQGIQFEGKIYNNGVSLKDALYLLRKHPRGKEVFELLPEQSKKDIKATETPSEETPVVEETPENISKEK